MKSLPLHLIAFALIWTLVGPAEPGSPCLESTEQLELKVSGCESGKAVVEHQSRSVCTLHSDADAFAADLESCRILPGE
ncbi:MAG: hypothetical protein HS115_17665 [Spirochaetales bacterium]|nr:hypothetical protein [Spirochaetales bacterium]